MFKQPRGVKDDPPPAGVSRFVAEHAAPGVRASVVIDVDDAQFDARTDWSVLGALLDHVGARRTFMRRTDDTAARAVRDCREAVRAEWNARNPQHSEQSPELAAPPAVATGGTHTMANPRYRGRR